MKYADITVTDTTDNRRVYFEEFNLDEFLSAEIEMVSLAAQKVLFGSYAENREIRMSYYGPFGHQILDRVA